MRFLRPKSPFKASVTNATGTVRKKDKGDLQDSCSTLGLTKNAIDEKIAAFFEDRPFFYDIKNAL